MLSTIIMISAYNNIKWRRWDDKECEKDLLAETNEREHEIQHFNNKQFSCDNTQ